MSDAGHAKNTASFETLINIVTALGAIYDPTSTISKIPAMQTMLGEAEAAITEVGAKSAEETNAVKLRADDFEDHEKLATRIYNAYLAGDSDELVADNLAAIIRKLRGKRKGEKPEPVASVEGGTPVDKSHSVSQLSYDSLVANWRLLIQLLETQPAYKPNENDLKISALTAFVDNLDAVNNAAKLAAIAAQNARANRDRILYDAETGMLTVVRKVKQYVKSLPDAQTAYQQLIALEFKWN
jgi:hypothetical protein